MRGGAGHHEGVETAAGQIKIAPLGRLPTVGNAYSLSGGTPYVRKTKNCKMTPCTLAFARVGRPEFLKIYKAPRFLECKRLHGFSGRTLPC